jgi:hypothetical protein
MNSDQNQGGIGSDDGGDLQVPQAYYNSSQVVKLPAIVHRLPNAVSAQREDNRIFDDEVTFPEKASSPNF